MNEFVDIKGYEGLYKINKKGEVLSFAFYKNGIILKQSKNRSGYPTVGLHKDKKLKTCTVHRLVASTFIDNPLNKEEINHIDGNKENNYINNLEWATHSENMQHAWNNGLQNPQFGEKHHHHKITSKQVDEIRYLRNIEKLPLKEIAKKYNSHIATISDIALYRRRLYG